MTAMIIEQHPKMMARLAGIYIDTYKILGYDAAQEWAGRIKMPADFQTTLSGYIKKEAERRNLRTT
jgi:hypothetical protein